MLFKDDKYYLFLKLMNEVYLMFVVMCWVFKDGVNYYGLYFDVLVVWWVKYLIDIMFLLCKNLGLLM